MIHKILTIAFLDLVDFGLILLFLCFCGLRIFSDFFNLKEIQSSNRFSDPFSFKDRMTDLSHPAKTCHTTSNGPPVFSLMTE